MMTQKSAQKGGHIFSVMLQSSPQSLLFQGIWLYYQSITHIQL